MEKVKLENVMINLNEKLKNPKFKKGYELECARVALAQKISELRDTEHLKQSELAKRMNVSQQFISQIENADQANLTLETLLKIAKSLNRGIKISFPKLSKQNTLLKFV